MGIFSTEKVIVGLFDNENDVEKTVNELSKHGFGGEDSDETVEVYERARFEPVDVDDEEVIVQPSPGTGGPAGMTAVTKPTGQANTDHDTIRQQIADELQREGIDAEQSRFFAERVARGGTLVFVKAAGDRISEATNIIQENSSKEPVVT
ncbi:MAG: hypothetical protein R3264_04640 [Anaerolineae bacterium]|nr:hypothetical protein [Anaerolineae bacterium]